MSPLPRNCNWPRFGALSAPTTPPLTILTPHGRRGVNDKTAQIAGGSIESRRPDSNRGPLHYEKSATSLEGSIPEQIKAPEGLDGTATTPTDAPTTPPLSDDDRDFYNWLAGFVDGEGCFTIYHPGVGWAARLIVKVRHDDHAIIREIVTRTGIGRVYDIAARGTSNAQTAWQVENKHDCLALVGLFDRYRLRAKKARDYLYWRDAVMEWQTTGKGLSNGRAWARMEQLSQAMNSGRAYSPALHASQPLTPDPQLRLVNPDEEVAA